MAAPNRTEVCSLTSSDDTAVAELSVRLYTTASPLQPQNNIFSRCETDEERSWKTPAPRRFLAGNGTRHYRYKTRRKASPPPISNLRARRLVEANTTENPFEKIRKCCSSRPCFLTVDKIHALSWYRQVMEMERETRKTTLVSWYNPSGGYYEFGGKRICWDFLRKGFGFSNDIISDVAGKAKYAAQTSFAQPRDTRNPTLASSIVTLLTLTSEACGEKMPHRPFINPPFTCKETVYQHYIDYFHSTDPVRFSREPPKLSYFYYIWKKDVPDVRMLKNTGFEKCSECVFYRDQRDKNFLNQPVLRELQKAAKQHYNDTKEERRGYELRKQLSSLDPKNYLSLTIDRADQSNYGLPHFVEKSKDDRGHKMSVKLVGVLMHGVENELYLFSMVEGFETGANHVIESLNRALDMRKKKTGMLPAVLYVQADNYTRENKNRYFFSYLGMLVAQGVFVEVQLSTMAVGHTHTDIDQSFSCVNKRSDKRDPLCLRELHRELEKCYVPRPPVSELSRMANFSVHCTKSNCLEKVSNFSQYSYFRFLRGSNNPNDGIYKTMCNVKINLSDERKPLREENVSGFLKNCPNLINFPKIKTRPPPDVREVNACLKAAEARIESEAILRELYDLRDRVYEENDYEANWGMIVLNCAEIMQRLCSWCCTNRSTIFDTAWHYRRGRWQHTIQVRHW